MNDLPIFYLSNDSWRGVGMEGIYDNYYVISVDDSPYIDFLDEHGVKTFSLARHLDNPNPIVRNTRKLVLHPLVQDFILQNSTRKVGIVFFKSQFDVVKALAESELGKKREIISLNPKTVVAKRLENKINFYNLCVGNEIPTPKSTIINLHSINYEDAVLTFKEGFVVQFEVGWFGNKTFFINSLADLLSLQEKYKDTQVKVSSFIKGTVLTNNVVVGRKEIYQTYPFLQITDKSRALARNLGSTVGNAWLSETELPVENASNVVATIRNLTNTLGEIARLQGFVGYSGFDFLISENGEVFAQEMNARFTASTPMVSVLEREAFGASILDEHYRAFGIELKLKTLQAEDYFNSLSGSRIVVRNTLSETLTVDSHPKNGVYYLNGNDNGFKSSDFDLTATNENEFVLTTVSSGREVNPDQEVAHLMSKTNNYEKIKEKAKQVKEEIIKAKNKKS